MASGHEHDNSTKRWSLPFALFLSLFLGINNGLIGGLAFLLGGFWLSPDLDTKSNALKRWGILQALWEPYRRLIPHRSIFSHGPFIGTTLRLFYLTTMIILLLYCLKPIGITSPQEIINLLMKQFNKYPQTFLALFIGIEASAWLHLMKDGDPFPTKWRKW